MAVRVKALRLRGTLPRDQRPHNCDFGITPRHCAARGKGAWCFCFAKPFLRMAQAIMDPEEVRRFAKELKRFNDDLQVRASALQARFTALGSTWQDQEHEKFAEEFVTTMKALKKFVESSERH